MFSSSRDLSQEKKPMKKDYTGASNACGYKTTPPLHWRTVPLRLGAELTLLTTQ